MECRVKERGVLSLGYAASNDLMQGTQLSQVSTQHQYNAYGELDQYQACHNTSLIYEYDLQRNSIGQITGKTETLDGTTTQYDYQYDDRDRLIGVMENGTLIQSWDYDANGNRTHENGIPVAHYDAQDRLISYGNNQYRYTANGEMTQKTDTETSEITLYDYDAFSNLRSVTLPDGTEIEYVIDGQNRRVGKKRNGLLEQGFLYEGQLNPIAELDGSNNVVARYVYGERDNVPSYMIRNSTDYRIITDHLGSVRLVVNASTGEIVQRMDYDAWGNVTEDTNPGFQPFGYAGGIYDLDTGLTRFGARDYDPEAGRWTTKDPIGFDGGLNQFAYADNDPINYIDPEGLSSSAANPWDHAVYPATFNCPAMQRCMDAWGGEISSSPEVIDDRHNWTDTVCKVVGKTVLTAAKSFGIKMAQSMVCSSLNASQCKGNSPYIPWVPGMSANTHWTDLPGMPDDAYFNGFQVVTASGETVDRFGLLNIYGESVNSKYEEY